MEQLIKIADVDIPFLIGGDWRASIVCSLALTSCTTRTVFRVNLMFFDRNYRL